MTDEEKAKDIVESRTEYGEISTWSAMTACEEIAEWKDEQFEKYLKKKRDEVRQCKIHSIGLFPNDVIRYNGAIEIINEIINELFPKTEEQDNSENDE